MFENKKILILGMARSGYEAAKVLIKRGNTVILNDGKNENAVLYSAIINKYIAKVIRLDIKAIGKAIFTFSLKSVYSIVCFNFSTVVFICEKVSFIPFFKLLLTAPTP